MKTLRFGVRLAKAVVVTARMADLESGWTMDYAAAIVSVPTIPRRIARAITDVFSAMMQIPPNDGQPWHAFFRRYRRVQHHDLPLAGS